MARRYTVFNKLAKSKLEKNKTAQQGSKARQYKTKTQINGFSKRQQIGRAYLWSFR